MSKYSSAHNTGSYTRVMGKNVPTILLWKRRSVGPFLLQIIGAVTTYLVILIQFQLSFPTVLHYGATNSIPQSDMANISEQLN
jgi:hypothetical protein